MSALKPADFMTVGLSSISLDIVNMAYMPAMIRPMSRDCTSDREAQLVYG